jgi:RimJ/RimL family protein N-acetyltransferase
MTACSTASRKSCSISNPVGCTFFSEPVGCGLAAPVIPGRPDIDIGIFVYPEERGRGYGTHIASYMKHGQLERGLRPVVGCAVGNTASRGTLTRAGFITEHQLLEVHFG